MTDDARSLIPRALVLGLVLVAGWAWSPAAAADPPGRVGRIGDSQGSVVWSPVGEPDWFAVERNRPLARGDRLWTDDDGRAEMQVGSAALRLAPRTSVEVLDLDDEVAQFELTQGTVDLRVLRVYDRQSYEIATPRLAFVVQRAGRYRVDVDPRRDETTIVVWEGGGEAYGEGARFTLRAGEAVRFSGTDLRRHELLRLPRPDRFDDYCRARDRRLLQSASLRYVDDDLVGYADLDEYGAWSVERDWGNVWYPRGVGSGWAPYRDGRWVWRQPWGWTWVDAAPWGFAPLHYGRWARIGGRWGWIPGPRRVRAVYAPALVVFVGGSGWSLSLSSGGQSPVGWFPLGPREAYVPTYRASRDYFERVNRHNTSIADAVVASTYDRYARGSGRGAQERYAYRDVPGALTAVPGSVFTEARPVREATLQVDPRASRSAEVLGNLPLRPGSRSARGRGAGDGARPDESVLERPVFARHAAPADADAPAVAGEAAAPGSSRRPAATGQRDPRARGNVRLLQSPEAQPDVRRGAPGERGNAATPATAADATEPPPQREPVAPSRRESERTAADQRQRAAQDELQRQAERNAAREENQRRAEGERAQDAAREQERRGTEDRDREQAAAREQQRRETGQRERAQSQEQMRREATEREAADREAADREAADREARGQAQQASEAAERERAQAAAQAQAREQARQEDAAARARRAAPADAGRGQPPTEPVPAVAPVERGDGARGRNSTLPPPPTETVKPDRKPGDRPKKDGEEDEADDDGKGQGKRKPDDGT